MFIICKAYNKQDNPAIISFLNIADIYPSELIEYLNKHNIEVNIPRADMFSLSNNKQWLIINNSSFLPMAENYYYDINNQNLFTLAPPRRKVLGA